MPREINQKAEKAQNVLDFAALPHTTADEVTVNVEGKSGTYSISLVNTKKHGRRMTVSQLLWNALGEPPKIQFVTDGNYLYIGAKIPHANVSIPFSKGVGKNIIYARGFIEYITTRYKLDFSDKTSILFRDIEVIRQDYDGEEILYAKIRMSESEE